MSGLHRHAGAQTRVVGALFEQEGRQGYCVMIAWRVQVSPTRVRVPDVCLVARDDRDEIQQRPPLLWIGVLSPDDQMSSLEAKFQDCLRMGVKTIWIIDPYAKEAWVLTPEAPMTKVQDGFLRCADPVLEVKFSDVLPEE